MFKRLSTWMFLTLGTFSSQLIWATPTAQNITGLTLTGVASTDYSGEITIIVPSVPVVTGCTNSTYYVVRDPNSISAFLAIATSALIAGRTVDVFVSGACDTATGEPVISQIVLH